MARRRRIDPAIPRAVALGYDPEADGPPRVVAAGAGEKARRILEIARQNNVPIQEDPGLLEVLGALDVGEEIPAEVYQAVAEILAFIYRLEESMGTQK